VASFVVAALLTPADPFSMLLMAVPLMVLYEVSVLVAKRVNPVVADTTPASPERERTP
jgi:sec-independent protein translocase protein TatC